MKLAAIRNSARTAWAASALIATGMAACGNNAPPAPELIIPTMPMPMPGAASIAGRVLDADGQPIIAATIVVAETDATTNSDPGGYYRLDVPSDSTITLAVSAPGFARTYRESVILASQSNITEFDVRLLPSDEVTAMNAVAVPDQPTTRGLMAIRLHSMSDACLTTGTHISVWPPLAATVVYSQPGVGGAMDVPDPTLDGVQPDAAIAAWLVGAVPPANMIAITVQQSGCQLMIQSPSLDGLMFPGQRRVDAQALTEADLFLQ